MRARTGRTLAAIGIGVAAALGLEGVVAEGVETQEQADLLLQQAIAEQRSAEAGVEKQREYQAGEQERGTAVQARFYEQGADVAPEKASSKKAAM